RGHHRTETRQQRRRSPPPPRPLPPAPCPHPTRTRRSPPRPFPPPPPPPQHMRRRHLAFVCDCPRGRHWRRHLGFERVLFGPQCLELGLLLRRQHGVDFVPCDLDQHLRVFGELLLLLRPLLRVGVQGLAVTRLPARLPPAAHPLP